VREWVERRSTTQVTLTRRCAPASPWQGEASVCCFVGNSRQPSVRSVHRGNPTGRECRGDPVGRPVGPAVGGHPRRCGCTTTGSTLTRRCAPASPCQGEASFLCLATAMCKPSLRRTKRRRLLSLALARARERIKGEGVGRTSIYDATHPHPALFAGLSLAGRGVFSLP